MERNQIAGIAADKNEARLTLTGVPDQPGTVASVIGPLAEAGIPIDMIVHAATPNAGSSDLTFTVPRASLAQALAVIEQLRGTIAYSQLIHDDRVAKVSIVGIGIRSNPQLAAKMFEVLAERQINLLAVSSSEIKVSALIAEDQLDLAVRVLHTAFGLDAPLSRRPAGVSGEGLIAEPRAVHTSVGHARLKELMHRGTEFLGCDVAIMGGAMSWISERHLVSAISNAGGFGVIACGAMGPELLDTEIAETKTRTDRPFGVNLITMHPQLSELIDVCASHRVTHVVLAGGLPPSGAIDRIKSSGAKLTAFSPALSLAKKLMRSGVDALVIEGMEAGGHIGPVSTSVLAQEILPNVAKDIPVFVAGGIGRGEAIAAYLEMGAVGVQLGTRFVCAEECIAHPNFKKAFIRASARDAIPSVQIDPRLPVIPVRALKNQEMVNFAAKQREVAQKLDDGAIAMAEAQLQIEHYWAGALKRAVIDGDVESGSVMAGQSVGMVSREEPVAAIIASWSTKPRRRSKVEASAQSARSAGRRPCNQLRLRGERLGRAVRLRFAGVAPTKSRGRSADRFDRPGAAFDFGRRLRGASFGRSAGALRQARPRRLRPPRHRKSLET